MHSHSVGHRRCDGIESPENRVTVKGSQTRGGWGCVGAAHASSAVPDPEYESVGIEEIEGYVARSCHAERAGEHGLECRKLSDSSLGPVALGDNASREVSIGIGRHACKRKSRNVNGEIGRASCRERVYIA